MIKRGQIDIYKILFFSLIVIIILVGIIFAAWKFWPSDKPAHIPATSEILGAYVEGIPISIKSTGDLWLNTWADDDNIYSSWGDGSGFGKVNTDLGIARIEGNLPNINGFNLFIEPLLPPSSTCDTTNCKDIQNRPDCCIENDDKPSSLLFMNKILYAQFHSPLGDPTVGYLAYSNDYGFTWTRLKENSPWTATDIGQRSKMGSNFRCMFFINMGKNYELNTDGYVYAFGIGREWGWSEDVYLVRVLKDNILDYNSYEYFTGLSNGQPTWSLIEAEAVSLDGLTTPAQFSVVYHPGTERYIIMTEENIYDAPNPWGPWKLTAKWVTSGWRGYQPGIISKDMGENYFWFTISGQSESNPDFDIDYNLNLGKIILELNDGSAEETSLGSCGDGICDGTAGEKTSCPADCHL